MVDAVRQGKSLGAMILVEGKNNDLIIVDGNNRAVAYVVANVETPVAAFIGSSPSMSKWAFF